MAGHPDAAALVEAVRGFIAGLALDGREAFHAKVAANALAIVARELDRQPDVAEAAVLGAFLASQPSLVIPAKAGTHHSMPQVMGSRFRENDEEGSGESAAATLSARIRDGTLTTETPGLLDALIDAAVIRLRVDNPRYATLARLAPDAAVR